MCIYLSINSYPQLCTIISEDIIKVGSSYYCSEDHIKARKKADPKPVLRRGGGYMDYGYGICTENGWQTRSLDEI